MIHVHLEQCDIYNGNLILVNKYCPITAGEKEMEKTLTSIGKTGILLEVRSAGMLMQLIRDLNCEESIVPVSGYRSFRYQQQIYTNSLLEHGSEFTEMYVARPNQSEHQTGLAIDLAEKTDAVDFLRPHFPYKGICQQFRRRAIQYGFIERYPEGKEKITGIAHEPWHFRYVGYPHSEIMDAHHWTLEEYTEFIKNYLYGQHHLIAHHIEIFYIPMEQLSQKPVEIPDNTPYQVSGNNRDGFIFTVWRGK